MALLLLGMIACLYISSRNILLSGFLNIERLDAQKDIIRALNALSVECSELDILAIDFAASDSTYQFIKDADQGFIDANLNDLSLRNFRLDLIAFVDAYDKIVFVRCIDKDTGKEFAVPEDLDLHIRHGSQLLTHRNKAGYVKGFILLDGVPMMVASRPILTSKWNGPARGSVIVGRYLREPQIKDLATRIGTKLLLSPIMPESPEAFDVTSTKPLSHSSIIDVVPINDVIVAGRTTVSDIYGNPVMTLEIRKARSLYGQGRITLTYLLLSLTMIGLLFGLLVELILDRYVLNRLAHLSRDAGEIGKSGDLSARISMSGHDELARLAMSVNGMLAELEKSQIDLRKREALQESEEKYRGLVEVCPDAVVIVNDHLVVFANPAAAALVRANSPKELLGRPILEIVHPEHLAEMQAKVNGLLNGQESILRCEVTIIAYDGTPIDVELAGIMFSYQDKPAIQILARDITDKKRYRLNLDHLAHHDYLTGLPNRLLFSYMLTQRLADSRRNERIMAVVFVDLDRFKMINDTLGHECGDMLLKEVSLRLQGCLRDVDTIARVGGDEFMIILSYIASPEHALLIVQRALKVIAEKYTLCEREVYTTASMGVSIYPNDGTDVDTLVKNADAAMYRAKELGGDCYQLYTQELNSLIIERMRLETDLRKSLDRDEFTLCYQPRVDLRDGTVLGMEALLRWNHPEFGVIKPMDFIPIAEETGLIIPISEWVLHTACIQNKAWQDEGYPAVTMAVNISPKHFLHQGRLVDMVKRVLSETGLSPTYLELEVTETALMQDATYARQVLKELREMGVRISVDDFGTGYSSLSYLKTLPLDAIKIDRSFVKEITSNPDDAAIVVAVIAMAHSLYLKVIAEGVETQEQLQFLHSLQCDEMQGYLVSRPVPSSEFIRFFENYQGPQADVNAMN